MRILSTERLRFPEEGSSALGKSGPKVKPIGEADGQQVEIPVPPEYRLTRSGDRRRLIDRPDGIGRLSTKVE